MEQNNQTNKSQENKNKKRKEERNKKNANSDGDLGEICLSCWFSPSDFLQDPFLVFCQLQVQGGSSNFWQQSLYPLPLPLEGASVVTRG